MLVSRLGRSSCASPCRNGRVFASQVRVFVRFLVGIRDSCVARIAADASRLCPSGPELFALGTDQVEQQPEMLNSQQARGTTPAEHRQRVWNDGRSREARKRGIEIDNRRQNPTTQLKPAGQADGPLKYRPDPASYTISRPFPSRFPCAGFRAPTPRRPISDYAGLRQPGAYCASTCTALRDTCILRAVSALIRAGSNKSVMMGHSALPWLLVIPRIVCRFRHSYSPLSAV